MLAAVLCSYCCDLSQSLLGQELLIFSMKLWKTLEFNVWVEKNGKSLNFLVFNIYHVLSKSWYLDNINYWFHINGLSLISKLYQNSLILCISFKNWSTFLTKLKHIWSHLSVWVSQLVQFLFASKTCTKYSETRLPFLKGDWL